MLPVQLAEAVGASASSQVNLLQHVTSIPFHYADLLEKAGEYTQEVATAGLLVAIAVAGVWWADSARRAAVPSGQQQRPGADFARPLLPGRKSQQLVEEEF
jgi:hypothetical protein